MRETGLGSGALNSKFPYGNMGRILWTPLYRKERCKRGKEMQGWALKKMVEFEGLKGLD